MAFFDKLKFWKKKEDTFAELDKQLGTLGAASPGQMPATPGTEGAEMEHPLGLETGYGEPFGDQLSRAGATGMEYEQPAESSFAPFSMEHPAEERRRPGEVPQQYGQPLQPIGQAAPISQNMQHQFELVSAKLDTIRVSLESINHRLAALERTLHVPEYEEEQPAARRRRGVW